MLELTGIAKICFISSSKNTSCTSALSQSPVIGSISSETFDKIVCPRGVIGLLVTTFGTQGSDQMFICDPSPTLQIKPSFNACKPQTMLLYEIPGPSDVSNKWQF